MVQSGSLKIIALGLKMKSTELSVKQWHLLRTRLSNDYSPSVTMVRWKMKEKLGFTPRDHKVWDKQSGFNQVVFLDWFDEAKRTMFMLKYSEYFNERRN